jgi:hypothetical protein
MATRICSVSKPGRLRHCPSQYWWVADDRTVVGCRRDQGVDDDIHGAAFDASNVGRFECTERVVDRHSDLRAFSSIRRSVTTCASVSLRGFRARPPGRPNERLDTVEDALQPELELGVHADVVRFVVGE